ncbi:hypothetical protein GF373_12750 [bacterium]|nr:hypothetical protein [bacterium]
MIIETMHYQFGFFAPGSNVEPEPEIISELIDVFRERKFIPSTMQTVFWDVNGVKPKSELLLMTNNSEWNMAFEPHRVLLTKKKIPGKDIENAKHFREETIDIYKNLFKVLPLVGTRLSFVSKGLLPEMPIDKLQQVHSKLFYPPKFFSDNPPHSWTTRNLTRYKIEILDNTETINVITDINRIQGEFTDENVSKPFDRIEIGFDINTYQLNKKQRFNLKEIELFLDKVIPISQQISLEIGEMIND